MADPTRSSKNVPSDEPVNQARAKLYERLLDGQEQIARARYERGVGHHVIQTALDHCDELLSADERREDLYVSALAHYVQALGGRLEVRAIFEDEAIVLRREPEDPHLKTTR